MRIALLGLLASVTPATAAAERIEAGAAVGAIRLDKRTPVELKTRSGLVRLEGGLRLTPRTAARLRLEGFRADGPNLIAALVAEVDLFRHAGAQGWAGLSAGGRSGLGSSTGVGLFARTFLRERYAVRADAFLSLAMRNDFGGSGLGVVFGLEWRQGP